MLVFFCFFLRWSLALLARLECMCGKRLGSAFFLASVVRILLPQPQVAGTTGMHAQLIFFFFFLTEFRLSPRLEQSDPTTASSARFTPFSSCFSLRGWDYRMFHHAQAFCIFIETGFHRSSQGWSRSPEQIRPPRPPKVLGLQANHRARPRPANFCTFRADFNMLDQDGSISWLCDLPISAQSARLQVWATTPRRFWCYILRSCSI